VHPSLYGKRFVEFIKKAIVGPGIKDTNEEIAQLLAVPSGSFFTKPPAPMRLE
jgi:hypothetical protein